MDPNASVFAGGEAVAVYACGLNQDFGTEEVAADEVVGYWGCGGCCFCVLGRGDGVVDRLLGRDTGRACYRRVFWESIFRVDILCCATGWECGFLHSEQ